MQSDNPKWSCAHLTFKVTEKYEIYGENGFQSLGFIIESIANWTRSHQNYTIEPSNFDLKLSQYI